MDISFVLLTWNSENYVSECLEALIDDLKNSCFSFEIFIVDNGSKDSTPKILQSFKSRYSDIIPIYLKKNTGTTVSRNIAIRRAKGEFIIIMDSDVAVSPGAAAHLIKNLKENHNAGLFVPRLLYPNGSLQKSTDRFPTVFTKFFRFFFLKNIEKHENKIKREDKIHAVDYAISAMWVLKKEIVNKIGLLDENIFYAPEDVDYCIRIWKAGYEIMYNPHISCIHHTQEISRGIRISPAAVSHVKGLFHYFRKHGCFMRKPDAKDLKKI